MKKLLFIAAVILGTTAASHAGVHVNVGIGLPLPPILIPGRVVVAHPAPVRVERAPVCSPAPVYVAPRYCPPPRVIHRPHPPYHSHHRHGYHRGHSHHGHRH